MMPYQQEHDVNRVWREFETFSPGNRGDVRMFFAPGRVNLIGEHLDYNGGLVFPAALTLGVWAWVRPRQDGVLRFRSMDFDGIIESNVEDLRNTVEDGFANYPKGVISVIQNESHRPFTGADFFYYSNLPNSAGLSSSAAIEVITGTAVSALNKQNISAKEIAILSQRAENQFVGVNCGIMDQFAVAMGKRDHAIALDCATLDYHHVPVHLAGYRLVITNTNARRGLSDSKYNERRSECEQALAIAHQVDDSWANLADISLDRWPEVEKRLESEPILQRRARHVITEQARTKEAINVLMAGEIHRFGQLMNASHASLRDDYEVTGAELDALAEAAWGAPGCIGSRMTGAGFGGCTVSIVEENRVSDFEVHVKRAYSDKVGVQPTCYVSEIGDGAHELAKEAFLL